MSKKPCSGGSAMVFRCRLMAFLLCLIFSRHSFAASAHIACDPKGGIWDFGLELVADTCVSKDMTYGSEIHFTTNALVCNPATHQVELFASYGDELATPADLILMSALSGFKVFANDEGTDIVMVHPDFVGTLGAEDMTEYSPGELYFDVFDKAFVLPDAPLCKKTPECTTCLCTKVQIGSTVDIVSGAISHSQDLFSLKGSHDPLSISLNYLSEPVAPSAIGGGWSHSYEQSLQILANGSVSFWIDGNERFYRMKKDNSFVPPPGNHSFLVKTFDGGYSLTEKDGYVRSFDASGRIGKLTDRAGNSTVFVYTNNVLTSVTDPNGRQATFSYDADGKLSVVSDPIGNRYVFSYGNGVLTGVSAPDGGNWSYTYGGGSKLASKTDPGGNLTSYSYDSNNRLTSSSDPQQRTRNVSYPDGGGGATAGVGKVPDPYIVWQCTNEGTTDPANVLTTGSCSTPNLVPVTEKNGGVWVYGYEPNSAAVKSVTDPYGNSTNYTHDADGNVLSKTEPSVGTTWYSYDASGNVLTVKDPAGNVTSYTYNDLNQVLTISGPKGNSGFVYDDGGNLTSSTDSAGATTNYEYDGAGNPTKVTNAKNQITSMTYDGTGQLASVTDPAGIGTTFTYDLNGNMLTSTGPDGATSYAYDAMNRTVTITDPLGNVTAFGYDKLGNRTSLTDANDNSTAFKFNYQGQVTEARDALGSATSLSYGATGSGSCVSCGGVDKLTALSDANNHTTRYAYDLLSRLTSEIDPLDKSISYSYDAASNLTSKKDANGATVNYAYNGLRQLVQKSYPDGTTETYTYDAAGRIATAINKEVGYTFSYDAGGRLANVADSRGFAIAYENDILGGRTKMTLQPGKADQHVTTYSYDTANRPKTITTGAGAFTYDYDVLGRRSGLSYPNGISASYQYDTLGRLTHVTHAAGGTVVAFANYSGFDRVGNRKSKTINRGTETYSYDPVYRLTKAATPLGTESYSYDAVGNRLAGPGPKDTKYEYNAGNQMIVGRILSYLYDNNGNQSTRSKASGNGWIATWDYENRPIKLEKGKEAEKRTVSFKYDPFGRRIEKALTIIAGGTTKVSIWNYIYDNENIALEVYTDPGGVVTKTFYTHGPGTDEHLALERNGSTYLYHGDGLGSVIAITDINKNVVQGYEYDSFGVAKPLTNFPNSYTYTGREWDKETGLYYYRARYYDPMEGRFISKDPIGFNGGINIYAYVRNNPINMNDPFGLTPNNIPDLGALPYLQNPQNSHMGPYDQAFYNAVISTQQFVNAFSNTIDGALAFIKGSPSVLDIKNIWDKVKPGAKPADACPIR